ncbi:MAG: MmgE/PrpD family protein [Mesorhizobium sp.]|nr:MmgE/PrpD family protein [Mesorhizobium sp.]
MALYALDTLAMALGGAGARSSQIARKALFSGPGAATVYGAGTTASPAEAALLNGTAAHALELDDDHRTSVMHPGAVVVPAAFAMAEATGASGRDFLRGVLAGYEVAIRAGDAYEGGLYRNGFHPTAVCGVFGAAAACSVILGLDEKAFARAMGIAGTQASGLVEWRTDGSWIKRLHPGRSAQSGLMAAQLAQGGFTGPVSVFEGDYGVFKALGHGAPVRASALTKELGKTFLSLGTAIKPFPCCRFSHGAIDLALEAHTRLGGRAPDALTVRLFRTDVLTYHKRPTNTVDAQFSVPYLVAVAMLTGKVGLSDFTEEAISRPEILDLASRIQVIEDPEFSALYPETYVTVFEIADGASRFELRNDCPSGDPEASAYRTDPDLLRRETIAKTKRILGECGYGARAGALVEAVYDLPHAPNVAAVAALLKPVADGPTPS